MKDLLIVVPYRNRQEHLEGFLANSPHYFNQQNLTYDILICELDQKGDWNAGLCVNSLVKFVNEQRQYKYLYIHHVDVWPTEGIWKFPEDNEVYFNLGDYGSCLMRMEIFFKVNGYSNSFWGWGGEDNELYTKLQIKGFHVNDSKQSFPVKYETKFQSHERKFNGANYGNGIKNLMVLLDDEKNDLQQFDEHANVHSLIALGNNIYKQIITPLKVSAREARNEKIVLGYLKNETNFDNIVSFVKSAMIYAGYSYDVAIIIADEVPPDNIISQLEAFGVNHVLHTPIIDDLFIDRHLAFKTFLLNKPHYKTMIHVDVTDSVFQDDPFKHFDNNKLTFSSEDIQIKNEEWNSKTILSLYGKETLNEIGDEMIICGGVIGGPSELYIKLANRIYEEYKKNSNISIRGIDQPCLQYILHKDKFLNGLVDIKPLVDTFCINLHVCWYYQNLFKSKYKNEHNQCIYNNEHKKFAVVHQYNRISELYTNIIEHYKTYFAPL